MFFLILCSVLSRKYISVITRLARQWRNRVFSFVLSSSSRWLNRWTTTTTKSGKWKRKKNRGENLAIKCNSRLHSQCPHRCNSLEQLLERLVVIIDVLLAKKQSPSFSIRFIWCSYLDDYIACFFSPVLLFHSLFRSHSFSFNLLFKYTSVSVYIRRNNPERTLNYNGGERDTREYANGSQARDREGKERCFTSSLLSNEGKNRRERSLL